MTKNSDTSAEPTETGDSAATDYPAPKPRDPQHPQGPGPSISEPEPTGDGTPIRVPDDHPLVKALASSKSEIRELKSQISTRDAGEKTAEERIASLEEEITQTRREALRRRVQAAYGIADADADLFLTASDEETLTKQAERLSDRARASEAEQAAANEKRGNYVPGEGRNSQSGKPDETKQFADFLTGH